MSLESGSPAVASRADGGIALTPLLLVVWGVVAVIFLLQGAAALPGGVSTDDAMRLVEVRDLLAGQGWFDLTQHRLNPPDGVVSHWSRLIDLPLAMLIAAAEPWLGRAGAENLVLAAWPLGLLLPALAGIARVALRLADARAAALALVLAVMTSPVMTHFRPAAIDHHNVQIVLLIWTIALILRDPPAPRAAAAAGLMAMASLAIGLEMLPAIAVIGAGVALLWIIRGRAVAPAATAFGSAFAGAAFVLFVVTVPPARYLAATCDAFSLAHVVAAGLGGLGLAALAAVVRNGSAGRRLAGATALGIVLGATMAGAFPACLGDPYDLGPRLTVLWLDHVSEARNFMSLARDLPQQIIPVYGFIVAALVLAIVTIVRAFPGKVDQKGVHARLRGLCFPKGNATSIESRALSGDGPSDFMVDLNGKRSSDRGAARWPWLLAVAVLIMLLAVSLWEMRGAAIADLVAVPMLCAALVRLFPSGRTVLLGLTRPAFVGALVLNQATLVPIGEAAARGVEAFTHPRPAVLAGGADTCERPADFAALARLPKGLVLAFIDSGPNILMASGHSVLAAPYHRNVAGNEAMLDVFLAAPQDARARIAALGVDYVAFCAGGPERFTYAGAAPDGLAARLGRGEVPDFLEPVPAASTPLSIFRVRR